MDLSNRKTLGSNRKLILFSTPRIKSTSPILTKNNSSINRIKIFSPLKVSTPNKRTHNGLSFANSQSDRFKMTIFEKFKRKFNIDMSSYFKSRKPKALNSIIDANKNMRPHTPEGRIEKTKKQIATRDAKHSAIRITKSSMIQMKREIFQFKLQEKFKKLSFRQEKTVKLI